MVYDKNIVNAIRALSMDAVQKANSGHPGMPMGMAEIATVLWLDFLKHNPTNPNWPNRDRFLLSNGHGCMLQYSLLHLSGYALTLEDIKQFRQLHSRTPGHPELKITPGIETTTGPLGQGLANAVGMAIAERTLAAYFNRPGFPIIDHFTYVFLGDGCLMEGISHEVCSLAGTLGLEKLIAFWDDNSISIDGPVEGWFTENIPQRFEAYGWHVVSSIDGHDQEAIKKAIEEAQAEISKPSLLCCKTLIGKGAPNLEGKHQTHGTPLGEKEINTSRLHLGWPYPPFVIPNEVYEVWDRRSQGKLEESNWQHTFEGYKNKYPDLAQEFTRRLNQELPVEWLSTLPKLFQETTKKKEKIATRKASQLVLNTFGPFLPELLGGSADLSESNLTEGNFSKTLSLKEPAGNYIHYGVREFGMSAIMNGIALHGGFIPYGGTFLTFSDYAKNALRLAALMQQRVIFVYTHDSIGLGEDGPTHQPVEQIASLRLIPNMDVWRPCDLMETAIAWQYALERKEGPTSLLLTRQALPYIEHSSTALDEISKGGYIIFEGDRFPQGIIIATGSEVCLAIEAAKEMQVEGVSIRVVSMPSTYQFDQQDLIYQEMILPKEIKARLAVEAAAKDYWYKYVGLEGKIIGLDRFGESAPAPDVYQALGITKENIIITMKALLQ